MSERESTQVPQTGAFHTFSLKPLPFSGSCLVDFQVDFSPRKNRYILIQYLVKAPQCQPYQVLTLMGNISHQLFISMLS